VGVRVAGAEFLAVARHLRLDSVTNGTPVAAPAPFEARPARRRGFLGLFR
jgi:hypothetical protein